MKNWFQRVILSRLWATFLVMGLGFLLFGVASLNLFYLARANFSLISEHGWQALGDGGALQFLELVMMGYVSMASFVVAKACEVRIVHWLADPS